jgi:CRP-like cAMP-binding protein
MNHEMLGASAPSRAGVRDRIFALRSQSMFDGLDDDGLLLLAEHGRTVSYADAEVICVEDEAPRAVFMVLEGQIVVLRDGTTVAVRKVGDAYGALPLLARTPSTLAVAGGSTRLLEIPAAAFEAALTENSSLLRKTLHALGSGVLQARGNLPVDTARSNTPNEGTYYTQPRTLVERLIQLRQSPFGRMNLDALIDFARYMREVRYPAGELLWRAGDPSTHALHIDVGRIRCTAANGENVAVGQGFTIGVLDAWSRTRVYDARSETPIIAFHVEFENFLALLETHPEVGLELLRGFARDLLSARSAR